MAMLQVQRLQHKANYPCEGADKHKGRQSFESNLPSSIQGKASHSCSLNFGEGSTRHPLDIPTLPEGMYRPEPAEVEASKRPTADSKHVWVDDKALAEAINAGLHFGHANASKLCHQRFKDAAFCVCAYFDNTE